MTTVKTIVTVELDVGWANHILTTAFDYAHGSANDWLVGEDVERIGDFRGIEPWHGHDGKWYAVSLKGSGGSIVVGGSVLNSAVSNILNDPEWVGTSTEWQLLAALETPDELPDLDGEACDAIVQVAMFGELIYG